MDLAFKQVVHDRKTLFIERIWNYLLYESGESLHYTYNVFLEGYRHKFNRDWDGHPDNIVNAKLHTIRWESWNVWKVGKTIHPIVNARTPNRFQFAPELTVKGIQRIWICHTKEGSFVKIDGVAINSWTLYNLAINEGFESVDDFFAYYRNKLYGIIIHWTDLKY